MKTKQNKKSGFTLVELMVVAIIVAILAAVAIPLMSGNRDRAIATEGQAGCGTIATGIKMQWVQTGSFSTNSANAESLPGIVLDDLDGTYFDHSGYSWVATDGNDYVITATSRDNNVITMTVVAGVATWTGYGQQ